MVGQSYFTAKDVIVVYHVHGSVHVKWPKPESIHF
jgi:hypothetical protein